VTLKRELRSYYGHDVNHGQLYPNLDELVDDGYVAKGTKDERTNAYSLTHAGREALASEVRWLAGQVDFDPGRGGEPIQ
jgi:DNA-binding PadR family transcriptional regulator